VIAPLSLGEGLSRIASDRAWTVLDARVGFQTRATYEMLGHTLGSTRGRAWQIDRTVVARLARAAHLAPIAHTLGALDASAPLPRPDGEDGGVQTVLHACHGIIVAAGYGAPTEREARRLLLIPRALADGGHDGFRAHYPRLARAACALPPAIMSHPDVAADVVRARHDDRERRHSLTYRARAVAVLREAGAPLHWREIADRADALGRGTRASRGALCNALRSGRDTFVRVGPGLYGLTAWRIASVAPYPDLIARVLHEAGCPLTPQACPAYRAHPVRPALTTGARLSGRRRPVEGDGAPCGWANRDFIRTFVL